MHRQSRPPKRSDGSTAVTATEGSGEDPLPVGAAGATAQTSRSKPAATDRGERRFGHPGSTGGEEGGGGGGGGETLSPSPSCRTKVSSTERLEVVQQKRSKLRQPPRRLSSGYFSFESDSLPSSPLSPRPATADKATQTTSPTGQVMNHALQRMEAHGGGPGTHQQQHGISPSPSSAGQQNAAGDMQAEAIGRELRLIGDDFNRVFMLRGVAVEHRRVVIHPNQLGLPHIYQEPTVLLCVGILLLLIGRIISQGSTSHQDH